MSSNVGLPTPRGSGTSGYIQRNMSYLKPRDQVPVRDPSELKKYRQREPDQSILEHDRKREIEVKCLELQDKLEDEDVDEEEIEAQVEALRWKLTARLQENGPRKTDTRGLKTHQVHELAAAKLVETERFRSALGISKDYEEGSHWRKQEEQRGRRSLENEKLDLERQRRELARQRSKSPPLSP